MRHGWMTAGVTAAISTIGLATVGVGGASAGGSASITVAATATCDGVVTAEYSYDLSAGQGLGGIEMLFTLGADSTSQSLPNVDASADPQTATGQGSASGYSPGDIVIVDVSASLNPAEADAFGTTTVEIPECPVVTDAPTTDAPTTDAPVETEAPADTDAPTDTEAPTETEAPADTDPPATPDTEVIGVPVPSTLPPTGRDALPTGAVAGGLLALGVGMIVIATRRRSA